MLEKKLGENIYIYILIYSERAIYKSSFSAVGGSQNERKINWHWHIGCEKHKRTRRKERRGREKESEGNPLSPPPSQKKNQFQERKNSLHYSSFSNGKSPKKNLSNYQSNLPFRPVPKPPSTPPPPSPHSPPLSSPPHYSPPSPASQTTTLLSARALAIGYLLRRGSDIRLVWFSLRGGEIRKRGERKGI